MKCNDKYEKVIRDGSSVRHCTHLQIEYKVKSLSHHTTNPNLGVCKSNPLNPQVFVDNERTQEKRDNIGTIKDLGTLSEKTENRSFNQK